MPTPMTEKQKELDRLATDASYRWQHGGEARVPLKQLIDELYHGARMAPCSVQTLEKLMRDREFRSYHGQLVTDILAEQADEGQGHAS